MKCPLSRSILFVVLALAALSLSATAQLDLPASPRVAAPTLTTEVFAAKDAFVAGDNADIAVRVAVPSPWHLNSNAPYDEFTIPTAITAQPVDGISILEAVYPEGHDFTFSFSPEPVSAYEGSFVIGVRLGVAETVAPGSYTLAATLRYQACNDAMCLPPKNLDIAVPLTVALEGGADQHPEIFANVQFGGGETPVENAVDKPPVAVQPTANEEGWRELIAGFKIVGQKEGYLNEEKFIAFIDAAESGQGMDEGFENKSIWFILGAILLGGLMLNLTPCVLPMIPINVAIIGAGAKAGSRGRGFALGGVFGLGIAASYGLLGLIVILTTGQFGALNASPWFNGAISVLFLVLGLAMFDKINIDFSRYQARLGIRGNKNGSFIVAFAMGCISALLAGACVAPVVIYVVIFSRDLYATGNALALALPFLLGVGMGLPWPFAGAGLSLLPKPGVWMNRVKYAFGLFIIGTAIYYGSLALGQFNNTYNVDKDAVAASAEAIEGDWKHSLADGLAEAKAENKPVLLDFWATWCKSCMTMNKTTLQADAVNARLEGFVKIKYQAEVLEASPTKEILEHFGVVGLPTYVVLRPKN